MSRGPITLELRDLIREAWEAAQVDEAGDRQVAGDLTLDRFLLELEQRMARSERVGRDWRGAAPVSESVAALCARALTYADAKDGARGGSGEGTVLLRGLVQALGVSIDGR